MKKSLLTGIVTVAFSMPAMADKVSVQGWDGFEPEPRIIKDNLMDDDATGEVSGNGNARVVKFSKPDTDINKDVNKVDCDDSRFSALCREVNLTMEAHISLTSTGDRASANAVSNTAKNDAMAHANTVANEAQRSSKSHADSVANTAEDLAVIRDKQALTYIEDAKSAAINDTDNLTYQAKIHADSVKADSYNYTDIQTDISTSTANSSAYQAKYEANRYAYSVYKHLKSLIPEVVYVTVYTTSSGCNSSLYHCNGGGTSQGGGGR